MHRADIFTILTALLTIFFFSICIHEISIIESTTSTTSSFPPTLLTTKKLQQQQLDDHKEEEDNDNDWSLPYIHILNTRFQQNQPDLLDLAQARLYLFRTFCLPSVLRQIVPSTTDDDVDLPRLFFTPNNDVQNNTKNHQIKDDPRVLWIIKIDPNLHPIIRNTLLELFSYYSDCPNIFIVGSNTNYGVGNTNGGWRGGEAGQDVLDANASGQVYMGDMEILRRAHRDRERRVVLETRLDADDGLNREYLYSVQKDAMDMLFMDGRGKEGKKARWLYWCALNHVAWDPTPLAGTIPAISNTTSTSSYSSIYGFFVPWRSPDACITAGITIASSVGLTQRNIPRFMHQSITDEFLNPFKQYFNNNRHHSYRLDCGLQPRRDCLIFVKNPKISALRSRTPTSAGMKGVMAMSMTKQKGEKKMDALADDEKLRGSMWRVLDVNFGVMMESARGANEYVRDHLMDIVMDNLRGQCTRGHSCKISSKEQLQRMADVSGKGTLNGVQTIDPSQITPVTSNIT